MRFHENVNLCRGWRSRIRPSFYLKAFQGSFVNSPLVQMTTPPPGSGCLVGTAY